MFMHSRFLFAIRRHNKSLWTKQTENTPKKVIHNIYTFLPALRYDGLCYCNFLINSQIIIIHKYL